jgi:nicotinamidase-related amidase
MPVTTLDPKAALIVINLQKGILSYPTVHPIGEVLKHTAALAEAFRRHHLPVVGAFTNTGLDEHHHPEFSASWRDGHDPGNHRSSRRVPGVSRLSARRIA